MVVEFDTFPNEGDVRDPPYQHVGINVNSMNSAVHAGWYASEHNLKTVFVSISCNATAKNLSVLWTYHEKYCNDVPKSSNISTNSPYYRILFCVVDLMEVLPEWATIGIRRENRRACPKFVGVKFEFGNKEG